MVNRSLALLWQCEGAGWARVECARRATVILEQYDRFKDAHPLDTLRTAKPRIDPFKERTGTDKDQRLRDFMLLLWKNVYDPNVLNEVALDSFLGGVRDSDRKEIKGDADVLTRRSNRWTTFEPLLDDNLSNVKFLLCDYDMFWGPRSEEECA